MGAVRARTMTKMPRAVAVQKANAKRQRYGCEVCPPVVQSYGRLGMDGVGMLVLLHLAEQVAAA
jgi:hypothetical protein